MEENTQILEKEATSGSAAKLKNLSLSILVFFVLFIEIGICENTTPPVPEWTKDIIMYQMRVDRWVGDYYPKESFKKAIEKLDYLADLGITAIWLTPIAKGNDIYKLKGVHPKYRIFYTHKEPDQLDPELGTEEDLKRFVSEAHKRGIKVFFDVVVHGVVYNNGRNPSSLIEKRPEFFDISPDGRVKTHARYNSAEFQYCKGQTKKGCSGPVNLALKKWYHDVLISWVKRFDNDGFRIDCEPHIIAERVGYKWWEDFRIRCKKETGKEILIIPEVPFAGKKRTERANAFAFCQRDFIVINRLDLARKILRQNRDFMNGANIVDVVKGLNGNTKLEETYYTTALTAGGWPEFGAQGRPVYFGYGCLFQPFIPGWLMGEEFNAPVINDFPENLKARMRGHFRVYHNKLDWSYLEKNKDFFLNVKKMIAIRKKYRDIIAPFKKRLCDTPIIAIDTQGTTDLPAYATYKDNIAIIVIGKKDMKKGSVKIIIPFDEMKMDKYSEFTMTDLFTDKSKEFTLLMKKNINIGNLPSWENFIFKIEAHN